MCFAVIVLDLRLTPRFIADRISLVIVIEGNVSGDYIFWLLHKQVVASD